MDLSPDMFVSPQGDRHVKMGRIAVQHDQEYHGTLTDVADYARSALAGLRQLLRSHPRPVPADVIPDAEWTDDETDW